MWRLRGLYLMIIVLVIESLLLSSCGDGTVLPGENNSDIFYVENRSTHDTAYVTPESTYSIKINSPSYSETYTVWFGMTDNKPVNTKYDPYEGTSWKLIDEHHTFPESIYVTLDPPILHKDSAFATLRIETKTGLSNGVYKLEVEANRSDFNKPRYFDLEITVDLPTILPPEITPSYEHETLLIAPGETKTNLVTINGIKQGQSFLIQYGSTNSAHLKDVWIEQSDTIFTPSKNTATFKVSIPDTTSPNINEEVVWLHPTYLNTNKSFDFSEEKNGFRVLIAGFNVYYDRSSYKMNFGDTLTIPVRYVVNGDGVFTPKLIPPNSFPSKNVVITQDVVSTTGKQKVEVLYQIYFKEKPTTNLTFEIGGDITYGKGVRMPIVIIVQ